MYNKAAITVESEAEENQIKATPAAGQYLSIFDYVAFLQKREFFMAVASLEC